MNKQGLTFTELQELRSRLWTNSITDDDRDRLVDVIHCVMDNVPYSELQSIKL